MEFGQDQIVVLGSNGCKKTLRLWQPESSGRSRRGRG